MEQDKTLQSLFSQFEQNQPELMSVEEVGQVIDITVPAKERSFNKTTISMTILSTIAISVLILLNQTKHEKGSHPANPGDNISSKKNGVIHPNVKRSEEYTPVIKDIAPLQSEKGFSPPVVQKDPLSIVYHPDESFPVQNETNNVEQVNTLKPDLNNKRLEIDDKISSTAKDGEPVSVNSMHEMPLIHLNDEELFKLGLIGKDGGIFYEETFNANNPFRFNYIASGNMQSVSCKGGDIAILENADKYPYIITDKYISTVHSMLNRKELKDTIEIYNNYKKYIPVIVSNKSNDPNSIHPIELIFWFPKSEYVLSLMPQWVRDGLAVDPDAFSWDMKTGREYRDEGKMERKVVRQEVLVRNPGKIDLIGDRKFIRPDKDLLHKLGFYYDAGNNLSLNLKYKKFYYKVHKEKETSYNLFQCPSKEYFAKVQENYAIPVPIYITDSICEMREVFSLATCNDGKENAFQSLINSRYQLTPVRIRFSAYETRYFWYMNNDKFLNKLNNEQLSVAESIMKDSTEQRMKMAVADISVNRPDEPTLQDLHDFEATPFNKLNPVVMDGSVTEQLGYKVVDNDLKLFINPKNEEFDNRHQSIANRDSIAITVLTHTKHGTKISEDNMDKRFRDIIMPVYISDDLGKYTYISIFNDSGYNDIRFEDLIPVLVMTGRSYNAVDMVNKAARPDYLLWYKATPEFLDLLPEEVKEDIVMEMKTVIKDSVTKVELPCKYTDVCKQHMENILKVNTYPNPTNNILNIDIKFKTLEPSTITLADLSGKVLLQKQWIPDSLNASTVLRTGELDSGIYYLYIQTSKGDMIVQKILVNH